MASSDFKKIHSEKRGKVRELNDIRSRTTKTIKDSRKSKREALLNKHRLVEVENIPEVRKHKTEVEEKLERLKNFKEEKLKRMEEQKKKQRPPFYSLVKTRHTGGTPFRQPQPMKKPLISLPPATRARTIFQKEFVFKATLSNPKEQSGLKSNLTFPIKSNLIKSTKNKENQAAKNNFKVTIQESLPENNVKKFNAISRTTVSKPNRSKSNKISKNVNLKSNVVDPLKGKNGVNAKHTIYITTNKSKENFIKKIHLNSKGNKNETGDDLTAVSLTKQIFISPVVDTDCAKQSLKKPTNSPKGSKNETKEMDKKCEVGENGEKLDESCIGPADLRIKLEEETARLTKMAEIWSARHTEESIPESVKDEILAVVGQTRLLISDKFQQFKSLIDNAQSCHKETNLLIKSQDLLGFWELVYLEVNQLNIKYNNLDRLRNDGWVSKDRELTVKKPKTKRKNRKNSKPPSSKFKEFLKTKKRVSQERMADVQFEGSPFKKTPLLLRTMDSECRKRRSSASTITLKKCFLAKAILSPYRKE